MANSENFSEVALQTMLLSNLDDTIRATPSAGDVSALIKKESDQARNISCGS